MSKTLADYKPNKLADFVGFERDRNILMGNIDALSRGIRMAHAEDKQVGFSVSKTRLQVASPHVLIYGLPGSGKTTLGELYAREMVNRAKAENWPKLVSSEFPTVDEWKSMGTLPNDQRKDMFYYVRLDASFLKSFDELDRYLFFVQAYGVILIDEIHNLTPDIQEKLYRIMEERSWQCSYLGKEVKRNGFTIVATTTDQSKLNSAFRRRFETTIELLDYSVNDLGLVVDMACAKAGVRLTDQARAEVVNRGRGTPADIVRLVNSVLRMMMAVGVEMNSIIGIDDVIIAAENIKFGPGGLEPAHARILRYLISNDGTPISAKGLVDGCFMGTVENLEESEVLLKSRGYITTGSRGRSVTNEGRNILSVYDSATR